jgi:hypothetical protein
LIDANNPDLGIEPGTQPETGNINTDNFPSGFTIRCISGRSRFQKQVEHPGVSQLLRGLYFSSIEKRPRMTTLLD